MKSFNQFKVVTLLVLVITTSGCFGKEEVKLRIAEANGEAEKTTPIEFTSEIVRIGGCSVVVNPRFSSRSTCAIVVFHKGKRIKAFMDLPAVGDQVLCRNGVAWRIYNGGQELEDYFHSYFRELNKIECVESAP